MVNNLVGVVVNDEVNNLYIIDVLEFNDKCCFDFFVIKLSIWCFLIFFVLCCVVFCVLLSKLYFCLIVILWLVYYFLNGGILWLVIINKLCGVKCFDVKNLFW